MIAGVAESVVDFGGVCGGTRGVSFWLCESRRIRSVALLRVSVTIPEAFGEALVSLTVMLGNCSVLPSLDRKMSCSRLAEGTLWGRVCSLVDAIAVSARLAEYADSRLSVLAAGKAEERMDKSGRSDSGVWTSGRWAACTSGDDVVKCPIWEGWVEIGVGRTDALALK